MSKQTIEVDIEKVKYLLTIVRNCCEEALDGTWEHSTTEGEQGFEPMRDDIEEVAAELGIELPPYYPNNEEEVA